MTRFSVGDPVIIRWGKQQGQKGKIIQCRAGHVFLVKATDGTILSFTEKGLLPEFEHCQPGVGVEPPTDH